MLLTPFRGAGGCARPNLIAIEIANEDSGDNQLIEELNFQYFTLQGRGKKY